MSYLCSCIIDDLFCGQITFVAHQQLVDGFARISIDFLKPLFDIVERLLICHIVDNDDTVCSAVVTVKETKKKVVKSLRAIVCIINFPKFFENCKKFFLSNSKMEYGPGFGGFTTISLFLKTSQRFYLPCRYSSGFLRRPQKFDISLLI